jgi:hypothetical protein
MGWDSRRRRCDRRRWERRRWERMGCGVSVIASAATRAARANAPFSGISSPSTSLLSRRSMYGASSACTAAAAPPPPLAPPGPYFASKASASLKTFASIRLSNEKSSDAQFCTCRRHVAAATLSSQRRMRMRVRRRHHAPFCIFRARSHGRGDARAERACARGRRGAYRCAGQQGEVFVRERVDDSSRLARGVLETVGLIHNEHRPAIIGSTHPVRHAQSAARGSATSACALEHDAQQCVSHGV